MYALHLEYISSGVSIVGSVVVHILLFPIFMPTLI